MLDFCFLVLRDALLFHHPIVFLPINNATNFVFIRLFHIFCDVRFPPFWRFSVPQQTMLKLWMRYWVYFVFLLWLLSHKHWWVGKHNGYFDKFSFSLSNFWYREKLCQVWVLHSVRTHSPSNPRHVTVQNVNICMALRWFPHQMRKVWTVSIIERNMNIDYEAFGKASQISSSLFHFSILLGLCYGSTFDDEKLKVCSSIIIIFA
jgi:hypothetical protein